MAWIFQYSSVKHIHMTVMTNLQNDDARQATHPYLPIKYAHCSRIALKWPFGESVHRENTEGRLSSVFHCGESEDEPGRKVAAMQFVDIHVEPASRRYAVGTVRFIIEY